VSHQVPFGQPPSTEVYRRQRGSVFARRHCQFPGCHRVIPDRKRAGYCYEHRPYWERERRRLAERFRRMQRAIREGRGPRPRSPTMWGWLFR
jgi:hypothetical protein